MAAPAWLLTHVHGDTLRKTPRAEVVLSVYWLPSITYHHFARRRRAPFSRGVEPPSPRGGGPAPPSCLAARRSARSRGLFHPADSPWLCVPLLRWLTPAASTLPLLWTSSHSSRRCHHYPRKHPSRCVCRACCSLPLLLRPPAPPRSCREPRPPRLWILSRAAAAWLPRDGTGWWVWARPSLPHLPSPSPSPPVSHSCQAVSGWVEMAQYRLREGGRAKGSGRTQFACIGQGGGHEVGHEVDPHGHTQQACARPPPRQHV
jgi:hypothetical protein